MDISNEEYQALAASMARKSPIVRDCALAFVIGGSICALGQALTALWEGAGLASRDAGTAAAMSLILLSVILTGPGLYSRLARYGGAGTLVPVTGFANAVASPAIDFKSEGLITGMAARMFQVAGPVLVYGISASVIYGVILWAMG